LGVVVVQINIIHIPKATARPGHGFFMLNEAKYPNVAIMQVIKNQIIVLIINQIYVLISK